MKKYNNNFVAVQTIGNFTLWINRPIYKEYVAGKGMKIINTQTGENMGKNLKLYAHLYGADLRKLPEEVRDEDCYTVVGE